VLPIKITEVRTTQVTLYPTTVVVGNIVHGTLFSQWSMQWWQIALSILGCIVSVITIGFYIQRLKQTLKKQVNEKIVESSKCRTLSFLSPSDGNTTTAASERNSDNNVNDFDFTSIYVDVDDMDVSMESLMTDELKSNLTFYQSSRSSLTPSSCPTTTPYMTQNEAFPELPEEAFFKISKKDEKKKKKSKYFHSDFLTMIF